MTETEKLLRDIETVRESIANAWLDLAVLQELPREDRKAIRQHIETLNKELEPLLKRLWELENDGADPSGKGG